VPSSARCSFTFHRAVCPDGFSLDFDIIHRTDPRYNWTRHQVDHGYFQAFAAAAAIGGIGGLAQIGNSGSVLNPLRDSQWLSEQMASEGEQNESFSQPLPVITLKEGSRARVYVAATF